MDIHSFFEEFCDILIVACRVSDISTNVRGSFIRELFQHMVEYYTIWNSHEEIKNKLVNLYELRYPYLGMNLPQDHSEVISYLRLFFIFRERNSENELDEQERGREQVQIESQRNQVEENQSLGVAV